MPIWEHKRSDSAILSYLSFRAHLIIEEKAYGRMANFHWYNNCYRLLWVAF